MEAINGRAALDSTAQADVPEGYTRLQSGMRCRCVRLLSRADGAYCCGGAYDQRPVPMQTEHPAEQQEPVRLVPTQSEADRAEAHKIAIIEKLEELLPLMTAARRDGFIPQFQLGMDAAQRDVIQFVHLLKYF